MKSKINILVTGANGQLGLTIKKLYSDNSLGLNLTFANKEELDITNAQKVNSYFKQINFDYCINCAAYTNVEQSEKTPNIAFKVNAEGVKNLALASKNNNVILIHVSTDYVFDGKKTTPYIETDSPNPINEYGKSKLAGEQYIQQILETYYIVRTSWLYSKIYGNNFYKKILEKAKQTNLLSVTNDQTGCPTNTTNLSKFLLDLILKDNLQYGILHYCDQKPMSWYDFAKKILLENKLLEQIKLVKAHNYTTFAKRPKYSVLCNTKME